VALLGVLVYTETVSQTWTLLTIIGQPILYR